LRVRGKYVRGKDWKKEGWRERILGAQSEMKKAHAK
jgi:hypothetical protein